MRHAPRESYQGRRGPSTARLRLCRTASKPALTPDGQMDARPRLRPRAGPRRLTSRSQRPSPPARVSGARCPAPVRPASAHQQAVAFRQIALDAAPRTKRMPTAARLIPSLSPICTSVMPPGRRRTTPRSCRRRRRAIARRVASASSECGAPNRKLPASLRPSGRFSIHSTLPVRQLRRAGAGLRAVPRLHPPASRRRMTLHWPGSRPRGSLRARHPAAGPQRESPARAWP